jgi:hypothetical protein
VSPFSGTLVDARSAPESTRALAASASRRAEFSMRHHRSTNVLVRGVFLAMILSGIASALTTDDHPSVEGVMSKLLAKYKQDDKKYAALADEIDKEVHKALKSTVWLNEEGAGKARSMSDHPLVAEIDQLSKAAQSEASKTDAKAKARRDALLAKFTWNPRLELDLGLDGGSDRPVPTQEKGYIAMGAAPASALEHPELHVNEYLWGLDTFASWHCGVKTGGKQLEHTGWDPKKPPTLEKSLPNWERIRVYLTGSLPEVSLFAVPWMEHSIHARLVERRTPPSGDATRMDQMLALLDSKWNGFSFTVPYAKERFVIVQSMHDLMTDRKSFVFTFPQSDHMLEVGDMPFISIYTISQYAAAFLGKKGASGKDADVNASFAADATYLSRYKSLIDLFVRSALTPNQRCPEYLAYLDYPKDKMPSERAAPAPDVGRRLALLVWAYVGKDPVRLADFLHDNLLAKEANAFPGNASLPAAFVVLAHEKEQEMLKAIATRITDERAKASDGATAPSDFEREFSPHPKYLTTDGDPRADFLVASHYAFHAAAAKVIQDAAFSVVSKELK